MTEERDAVRESLERLETSIDITRQNRINAATRLIETERFVQSINIYYSCVSAAVTVFALIYPDKGLSVLSAMLTITLAISIVYLNAQKYGNRAQQMQMNYLALQRLLFKVQSSLAKQDYGESEALQLEYVDLLQTSENHSRRDHWETMHRRDKIRKRTADAKACHPRLSGAEKACFCGMLFLQHLIRTLLWLLPLLAFAYFVRNH